LSQGVNAVGKQQSTTAHARGRQAGLGTGMATANHYDVKFFPVLHAAAFLLLPVDFINGAAIIRVLDSLVQKYSGFSADKSLFPELEYTSRVCRVFDGFYLVAL